MTLNVSAKTPDLVLDDRQRMVVEAESDKWLLVVAGPGTGKTQVAAMRLMHLLKSGLHPAQILVLSFSRSAVATLTRRLAQLGSGDETQMEEIRHLAVRTFDSWAFRMLRQSGATVGDLLAKGHDENISAVADDLADMASGTIAQRLGGIRHVIVDEFQDLPGVRGRMVIELLSRLNEPGRLRTGFTVLGDPAQAIYGFAEKGKVGSEQAGSWQELAARMHSGFSEIELEQNYRSTVQLAGMASSMRKILRSETLPPQQKFEAMQRLLGGLPASSPDVKLGPDWLSQLPEGSVAILTRTNGEALRVASMLMGIADQGPTVPVRLRVSGEPTQVAAWIGVLLGRFKPGALSSGAFGVMYDRAVSAVYAEEHSSIDLPSRDVCWQRLVRASGAPDSATSVDMEALRERLEWPDSFPDDQRPHEAGVYVTTVHQAKGMEFDNVALLEQRERGEDAAPEDPLEEANVAFVAMTRAGTHLGRIPATCIHRATSEREFRQGRTRQYGWGKMVNLQLGQRGDVDAVSFVSLDVHGDGEKVEKLQQQLMSNASGLRGHKVVLETTDARARDVRFNISIQGGPLDGVLLGRTSQQVTDDLLHLLWDKGYSLPRRMFNLRIGEVVTATPRGAVVSSVPEPWRSSGLWLGVSLSGTGDFKTWRRNGG